MSWTKNFNDRAFTSQISNSQQIVSFPGDYWSVSINFDALVRSRFVDRDYTALIGRMRGMTNAVRVPRVTRRNLNVMGNIVVNTPAQTGAFNIQLSGFAGGGFIAGDMITISNQIFEIVENSTVSGGISNIVLDRPMRSGIPAGTSVEYVNPYCVMRLSDNDYTIDERPLFSRSTLNLREAF